MSTENAIETAKALGKAAMEKVIQNVIEQGNDQITMRTVCLRFLGTVSKAFGLSWNQIYDLVQNCTPIHSQVAEEILNAGIKDDETEITLAQDFVRNERLVRLLKRISRRKAEALLAIDGLVGTISFSGPAFDFKRYLENLRYSVDGSVGNFDDGVIKGIHIFAVRQLYKKINDAIPGEERLSPYVYQVLRKVILDVGGPDLPLPSIMNEEMRMTDAFLKECVEMYLSHARKETVYHLISNLNIKSDKRERNEDDEPTKKRRVERETEN